MNILYEIRGENDDEFLRLIDSPHKAGYGLELDVESTYGFESVILSRSDVISLIEELQKWVNSTV